MSGHDDPDIPVQEMKEGLLQIGREIERGAMAERPFSAEASERIADLGMDEAVRYNVVDEIASLMEENADLRRAVRWLADGYLGAIPHDSWDLVAVPDDIRAVIDQALKED